MPFVNDPELYTTHVDQMLMGFDLTKLDAKDKADNIEATKELKEKTQAEAAAKQANVEQARRNRKPKEEESQDDKVNETENEDDSSDIGSALLTILRKK